MKRTLESFGSPSASESFKKMSDQIPELQDELKKKDPSVSERVHTTFAGSTNTVESWF